MSLVIEGPLFIVKLGKKLRFLWTPMPDKKLGFEEDLVVKAPLDEVIIFAERIGCTYNYDKKWIECPDIDKYNRVLLFSALRPTIKDRDSINLSMYIISNFEGIHAHYWASRIREEWWSYKSYRKLYKIIKAFKLFFGLM